MSENLFDQTNQRVNMMADLLFKIDMKHQDKEKEHQLSMVILRRIDRFIQSLHNMEDQECVDSSTLLALKDIRRVISHF